MIIVDGKSRVTLQDLIKLQDLVRKARTTAPYIHMRLEDEDMTVRPFTEGPVPRMTFDYIEARKHRVISCGQREAMWTYEDIILSMGPWDEG